MSNLKKQIETINEQIKKEYGENYILDGIVDDEKYLKAKYKILWILKEPNDGGGYKNWDMRSLLDEAGDGGSLNSDMIKTFSRIIYSSYGILNNFMLWDDMDFIKDNPDMIDVLKQIAVININKLPGESTSKDTEIQEAFDKHKELIGKQIEVINPEIIIGGNTIEKYMKDFFELEKLTIVDKIKDLEYYPDAKRVLVDAWHPANLKKDLTSEKYCNGIINAVKDWALNYKK